MSFVVTLVYAVYEIRIFWAREEALRVLPKKILRCSGTNLYKFGLSIRENVCVFTLNVDISLRYCLCQIKPKSDIHCNRSATTPRPKFKTIAEVAEESQLGFAVGRRLVGD